MNRLDDLHTQPLVTGVVHGTPRTYGDKKNDDIWRTEIVNGDWLGFNGQPFQTPIHLDFGFRINPRSVRYRGNKSHHGRDVDTMIIGALDALVCQRTQRPTMNMIEHRGLCRLITASTTIVDDDDLRGMTLNVYAGSSVTAAALPINGDL